MKMSSARISPVHVKYTQPVSGVIYIIYIIYTYRLDTRNTAVSPDDNY